MKKENRRFYGLLISVDGSIKYAEIPMEGKWDVIKKLINSKTTEQLPAGGFGGVKRILVCSYYGSPSAGVNERAMELTKKKSPIYGPALLFKQNELGYPALMTEGAAYKMKLEVERGW